VDELGPVTSKLNRPQIHREAPKLHTELETKPKVFI